MNMFFTKNVKKVLQSNNELTLQKCKIKHLQKRKNEIRYYCGGK